jgi:hypothetical protein
MIRRGRSEQREASRERRQKEKRVKEKSSSTFAPSTCPVIMT